MLCLVLGAGRAAPLSHAATIASGTEDAVGRMRAAVEAHGGRLEALADGSLVARVEASATPTEQAVRAARCAIAMRAIAPEVPLVLVAGRGMMRGPLPVGEVIERGGAILRGVLAPGAPTLPTGAAEPEPDRGGIRVDDVMAGLLEGRYEIARGPLGATLGEERREPTTARTLLGRTTPCVGRRRELATLEALFAECVEEPIARVAWITAPPGGGKSRLVAELVDRVTEREAPAVWIARGDPIGAGSPFGLLAQLVRAASGIADGEPLEARRAKILASVGGAIGGERGRLAAVRLGSVARTPFEDATSLPPDDPKLRGDAMREAFVEWLAAATGARPLLVVLDDLQWGDRPSLAFVSAAVRALSDRPLCVLAAGRPEASELFDALFEERDVELLRLARLTPRAAEELARHVLGRGADDALIARLVERADGNPFFLEELVRAVEESRGEGALPTTVLGMVEARLGVLDASTRRVLRAASVFGKRFWKGGVIELLGGAARAGDVDAHLAVLAQRELVDRVSDPRLTGQSELAFRSVLTREAALAMLTDEDRRLGHRLAGAWLETAGERDALVLAEHFSRGGDEARAATWLGRAAEQALEGDDLAAAVDRAERALAAASEPARGPILVTLADAHRWRGEYAQAFAHAALAAEALEPGTRAWFRALGVLFAAAGRVGRAWEAAPWRERAVSIEAHPDASGAQVVALCRAAALALASGDLARFEATLERAERLAQSSARGDSLARAWIPHDARLVGGARGRSGRLRRRNGGGRPGLRGGGRRARRVQPEGAARERLHRPRRRGARGGRLARGAHRRAAHEPAAHRGLRAPEPRARAPSQGRRRGRGARGGAGHRSGAAPPGSGARGGLPPLPGGGARARRAGRGRRARRGPRGRAPRRGAALPHRGARRPRARRPRERRARGRPRARGGGRAGAGHARARGGRGPRPARARRGAARRRPRRRGAGARARGGRAPRGAGREDRRPRLARRLPPPRAVARAPLDPRARLIAAGSIRARARSRRRTRTRPPPPRALRAPRRSARRAGSCAPRSSRRSRPRARARRSTT
ncbi:MAG: AAA family ATPase [Sandaracinaceae bacterium]|nr:AAA family ATPase [Sandaracinaceae bacterium]